MVRVGAIGGSCFWMDSTEVTQSHYAAFLAEGPDDAANVEVCEGVNGDFAPAGDGDLAKSEHPATRVDWCDAAAYCAWAGKTLCSAYMGNGAQWSAFETTCTDGDNAEHDWNAFKHEGICNGGEAQDTAAVQSFDDCVTPSLVYDLVGNAMEWTSECDGSGVAASCLARGGSFQSKGEQWGCKAKQSFPRTFAAADLGFRCCAEDAP